jgi:imidazole glycerol-phosphate synthase subunit HisH
MIVIIDYGLGNPGSIKNMLRKIGADSVISSDKNIIGDAEKLILPGVGSFQNGMKNLSESGLIDVLNKKASIDKTPVLGICLGMQLFTNHSEEGDVNGLGWIDAETIKFKLEKNSGKFSIPHMGWESVKEAKPSKLMQDMYQEPKFYFVHSYYIKCKNADDVLLTTHYSHPFVSGIEKENIIGVQFHPEKSHKYGMKLLQNFINNY